MPNFPERTPRLAGRYLADSPFEHFGNHQRFFQYRVLLECMTDSPSLRDLWLEKADRCACPGGFARYGIPATRSRLASPIRVQSLALKSCLVLCLAIFGTQLCLFRRVLFLVVDELSTLGRRPDNRLKSTQTRRLLTSFSFGTRL